MIILVKINGFPQAIASKPLVVNDSYCEGIINISQSTIASILSLLNKGPVIIIFSSRSRSAITFFNSAKNPLSGPIIANFKFSTFFLYILYLKHQVSLQVGLILLFCESYQ